MYRAPVVSLVCHGSKCVRCVRLSVFPQVLSLPDDSMALVMEYAPGVDMDAAIKQVGRLPEKLARWFFQQLIVALDFCHEQVRASKYRDTGAILQHTTSRWESGGATCTVPQHTKQTSEHPPVNSGVNSRVMSAWARPAAGRTRKA